jgi:hypothetical protein
MLQQFTAIVHYIETNQFERYVDPLSHAKAPCYPFRDLYGSSERSRIKSSVILTRATMSLLFTEVDQ